MTVDGECALVTGAARGIGAATARALAGEGWAVGVNYRSDRESALAVVDEIEKADGRAMAIQADVSRVSDVEALFGELEASFGRVAVLVNNAGTRADGLSAELADDDWNDVVETNLSAAFRTCRRALMPMVRARFGRIVNIASVVGPCMGNGGQANYAAAKAGLVGLTRSVAKEVAHRGVTVNAVAPGFVETKLTEGVDRGWLKAVPARRAGQPEEIAAAIRFLASREATYVTGITLTVDGGMTA
ncbi:MAG TPA: 3-oxoacyl-ACP reductase FabG [Thermoleophilaceae bacterium]|jgi:3-oxoacyl-[acyl-carrier protein] reductase